MTIEAKKVIDLLLASGKTLGTAESCTGGLLGKLLTDVPGSSEVYLGGVISYTNGVKNALLGVKKETLERFGAVSECTSREMAEGAKKALGTDLAVSVTGLAGPGGDGSDMPVGRVYIALSGKNTKVAVFDFPGEREDVREAAAKEAMHLLAKELGDLE